MAYHRNAPPPTDIDQHDIHHMLLTERALGNVPDDHHTRPHEWDPSMEREEEEQWRRQSRERWRQERESRDAFLDSGGTYIRLGKNVTFFVEFARE